LLAIPAKVAAAQATGAWFDLICRGQITRLSPHDGPDGRRWVSERAPFTTRAHADLDRRRPSVADCRAAMRPITAMDPAPSDSFDAQVRLIRAPGRDERLSIDRHTLVLTRDVVLTRCPQCVVAQPGGSEHWTGGCEDTSW